MSNRQEDEEALANDLGVPSSTVVSPEQQVLNFLNEKQGTASDTEIANLITSSGADLYSLADTLGIDRSTADQRFALATLSEADQSVMDFLDERQGSASDIEIVDVIQSTGADLNKLAKAVGIDQKEAQDRYDAAIAAKTAANQTKKTTDTKTADTKTTDTKAAEAATAKVAKTTISGADENVGKLSESYTPVDVSSYVEKPTVTTIDQTTGITGPEAIKQLDTFSNITPPDKVTQQDIKVATGNVKEALINGDISSSQYEAALAAELNKTSPAVGTSRPPISVEEIQQLSQVAQAAQVGDTTQAMAEAADFTISPNAFVPSVTGTAAVISPTREAEQQTREAITGSAATGVAAQILETVNYEAAQARAVTGTAAQGAAAEMVAVTGELPPNVAAAITEDPATVEAQIDNQSAEVVAAVAALPEEALVSAQLENLLGGMESGNIPTWAKPAVAQVEQQLAQRGMETSTVARDALFNAIIQSALPIAQSNAQAIQQRASQNLSNEQQANLQTAQLDMTRRMQNLANQQTAASQTAQMATNMAQLQSQFRQDATMLSAQQAQQMRTQNLANRQRSAEINVQNLQAQNALNLSNEQQMELANLEVMNTTDRANMTAENQARLAEFQVAADFLAKNAEFKQQMETANLTAEQQVRLANLTAQNAASADNLNAAQQTELANLNARMETNLTQAQLAQQMGVAQLNVNQQRAIENAKMVANIDLTKFSADQQVALANSQFMQTVTISNFNARQQAAMQNATAMASLDLATLDQRTRLAVENANNFLQLDLANLSNEQQAVVLDQQMQQQRLLSDQAAQNAAKQFNAATQAQVDQFNASLASQMEQFNAAQANAMAQFNATETNRTAAINAGNQIDIAKFNNQIATQIDQFNSQMDQQREIWNAQNAQAVEQSNIEWRRQANTIDTAAENAANTAAASQAYNLSTQELAFIWQELRDEATYARTAYENEQQRKTTLYATALANQVGEAAVSANTDKLMNLVSEAIGE